MYRKGTAMMKGEEWCLKGLDHGEPCHREWLGGPWKDAVNHKNVIERQLDFKTYMITLKILSAVKVLRKPIITYMFTADIKI